MVSRLTQFTPFDDWAKAFVNEEKVEGFPPPKEFSFLDPSFENWKDQDGDMVYIRTNDHRYPTEHLFYSPGEDTIYFYNIENKKSIAYPRAQVPNNNWSRPWIEKYREEISKISPFS